MENASPAPLYSIYKNIFDLSHQYIGILDSNSRFVYINKRHAEIVGYKTSEEALGTSYNQFKCDAGENHHIFREQDLEVLTSAKPVTFLSYYCLNNNTWRLLYGEKSAILNQSGQVANIFSTTQDITTANLVDLSRFLIQNSEISSKKIEQKSFTYYILKDTDNFDISKKEQEVLFFFIRGKSAQEISQILCRSRRTIEMHIDTLKTKLQVLTKSQLVEKAIMLGYITKIPDTLLTQYKLAFS